MPVAVPSPLEAWANFYVILGSSAAALTGLQFVVLTLIAQSTRIRGSAQTLSAFGSPNVVHFCAALLVSAIASAPWPSLGSAGAAITLCGAGGLLYSGLVLRRAHRQDEYQPVFEDWLWHNILPPLSYTTLLAAGILLSKAPRGSLFMMAGAVLLLVFIGIHNSWDTVTYVTIEQIRRERAAAETLAQVPKDSATGTESRGPTGGSAGTAG